MLGRPQLGRQNAAAARLSHHQHACNLRPLQRRERSQANVLAAAAVATQSQQALLNEELKHSRSAEHLLQLIQDHGESLNAVNVFTATTRTHHHIRATHEALRRHSAAADRHTQRVPPAAHVAGSNGITVATAAEQHGSNGSGNGNAGAGGVAEQLVSMLIAVSPDHVLSMSAKHCVAILTAHAWIRQMHPAAPYMSLQWQTLLQNLCDRLAAQADTARPADLSRAVWACAKLGIAHDGLTAAASQQLQAAAAAAGGAQSQTHRHHTPTHAHADTQASSHAVPELHAATDRTTGARQRAEALLSQVHMLSAARQASRHAASRTIQRGKGMVDGQGHPVALIQVLQGLAEGGSNLLSCLPLADATALVVLLTQQVKQHLDSLPVPSHVAEDTQADAGGTRGEAARDIKQLLPQVTAALCAWAASQAPSHTNHTPTNPPTSNANTPHTLTLDWLASLAWSLSYLTWVTGTDTAKTDPNYPHTAPPTGTHLPTPPHPPRAAAHTATVTQALAAVASMASAAMREHGVAGTGGVMAYDKVGYIALTLARVHRSLAGGYSPTEPVSAQQGSAGKGHVRSMPGAAGSEWMGGGRVLGEAGGLLSAPDVQRFMREAAELTTHHAGAFTLQTTLDMGYALSVCAAHSHNTLPPSLLQKAAEQLAAVAAARHAAATPAEQLIHLAWQLVSMGVVPVGLLRTLEARVVLAARHAESDVCDDMTPVVLHSDPMSGDGDGPSDEAQAGCDLIDDVTPSDVARLCSVLSRCKALQPDVFWPALTAHLDEAASVHAPDMDNQSLVVSISALASLGQTCTGLLDQVTTLIPRTSSSPVPSTHTHNPANHTDTPTTNTHSTRTNTRERRHGAVQASPRHTTQRPPLTPQQLAVCLWATARVLSGPEALLTSMGPLTLFRRAAPLLAQYVCELSDQGLAMVAYAYVSAEVHPGTALLTALQSEAHRRLPTLHPRAASLIIWALTHYKACDPQLVTRVADMLTTNQTPHHTTQGQPHQRSDVSHTHTQYSAHTTTEASAQTAASAGASHVQEWSGGVSGRWSAAAQREGVRVDVLVGLCVSLAKTNVRHPQLFDLTLSHLVLELTTSDTHTATNDTHTATQPTGPAHAATQQGLQGGLQVRAQQGGSQRVPPRSPSWLRNVASLIWAIATQGHRYRVTDIDLLLASVEQALTQTQSRGGVAGGRAPRATGAEGALRARRGRAEARLLAMLVMALPVLRYQPSGALLSAVCGRIAQQVQSLSTHTLCEVIWAFAALQYAPSTDVLDRFMCTVEQRVITDQQEILTLPSTVKLAWALACFKQYRHPLTRHAVAKALSCPPTAFIDKPAYLRMLLEVQRLVATEARSGGFWRALSRRWAGRKEGGAPEALPVNLAGQGFSAASNAALARLIDTLPSLLTSLGYTHATWQATPQGELTCAFIAAHSPRLPAGLPTTHPVSPTPPVVLLQPTLTTTATSPHTHGPTPGKSDTSRMAVFVLCPWHLSVNRVCVAEHGVGDGVHGLHVVRANAAVHVRLLRRKGFRVALITLEEMVGGGHVEQGGSVAGVVGSQGMSGVAHTQQDVRAWQLRVLATRLEAALRD